MFTLVEQGVLTQELIVRLLEEKLSIALWTWDLQTNSMRWSRSLYSLLDIEPDSIQPSYEAMEGVVHVDDRRPLSEIKQTLREGITVDREVRVITSDGRVRWISSEIVPMIARGGGPVRAVGICSDTTQQREASHLTKLWSNRFVSLYKSSQALFWTLAPNGDSAEILQSPSSTDHCSSDFRTLVHSEDIPKLNQEIATRFPLRQPFRMALRLRSDDGRYNQNWVRIIPITNDRGDIQEWIGISRDPKAARLAWSNIASTTTITGAQMRASRAILRWSVADLAAAAQVSAAVIRRLEEVDSAGPIEPAHDVIETTLRMAGVEFTYDPDGKPGVRPR